MPQLTTLTPSTVTIALLAALLAFLTNAYNTGKLFGITTVPVAALPYFGVGIPFIGAVYASLSQAGNLSALALVNAGLSGFFALLGSASGAGAHAALRTHFGQAAATKLARMKGPLAVVGLCYFLTNSLACQGCTKQQQLAATLLTADVVECMLNNEALGPTQDAQVCLGSTLPQDVALVQQILAAHKAAEARELVAKDGGAK